MSGKNTQNQEYIPVPVILRNNKTKVVMTAKIIVTLLRLKLNLFIIYKDYDFNKEKKIESYFL